MIDPFEWPEDAFRLAEDMSIEVNPEAFSGEEDLASAHKTLQILDLNCPALIEDRVRMQDEALRLIKERTNDDVVSIVSRQLLKQSRFIHREAVRKGYVKPV